MAHVSINHLSSLVSNTILFLLIARRSFRELEPKERERKRETEKYQSQ